MSFTRADLLYTGYSWTAMTGDNPKISGVPDSTLFNRHEGYEVVYLIGKFMERYGLMQKADGQKVERMIHEGLPGDVRSQYNVVTWLAANWGNY